MEEKNEIIFIDSNAVSNIQLYYNFPPEEEKSMEVEEFFKRMEIFKSAYMKKDLTIDSTIVNVYLKEGNINDMTVLSAIYEPRKGFLSRKIVDDEYRICFHGKNEVNDDVDFWWYTTDYDELILFFKEFIINHRTPDFDNMPFLQL